MVRSTTILIVVFSLLIFPRTQIRSQPDAYSDTGMEEGNPKIVVSSLEVSENTLKLRYEIRNDSEDDVWILMGPGESGTNAEVFMTEDSQTLMIRERHDLPTSVLSNPFYGRYIHLRAGEIQTESISLTIPVKPKYGLTRKRREAKGIEYATCMTIEIGYYTGDLPKMIFSMLEEVEKTNAKRLLDPTYTMTIKDWFIGLLGFNEKNESLRQRDEEVLIPYTHQAFKGEKVLRTTIKDLYIPYEEKEDQYRLDPPDLNPCTRVEIQYQPSMLEYFFPYPSQQSLLSHKELEYLRSEKTIVVEDTSYLKALAYDVGKGEPTGGIVRERNKANIVCYRDNECLMSLPIYNNYSIITEKNYRFTYTEGIPSLKICTPQIQKMELRVQCAANLRNLWYRLRLYNKAEKNLLKGQSSAIEIVYPTPAKWCNYMVRAYKSEGMSDKRNTRLYICPAVGAGRCHYAMSLNCKPDSLPDMVLLFETKGGWNQHGGPELFIFDNHDPKGGCVLLNDGTVKFIRTKEELQKLRWK
ncbi:MAG TPA: hypothetical protein VMW72_26010 [Sedimentisphaerales bacterium]|nr:hypothetical protein [Sedimentisphaerales bacterium]